MAESLSERLSGYWSFALAASAVPLSYLAAAPCGVVCGACPLGGACFAASPLMFVTVIAVKFGRSIVWHLQYAGARLTGNEPPIRESSPRPSIVGVEDPDDDGSTIDDE